MTPPTFVIATRNRKKAAEMRAVLAPVPIRLVTIDEAVPGIDTAPETGDTFEANATQKAAHYARASGRWCIADDSGLEVDALGGAPGVHSSHFAGREGDDRANNAKLLAELARVPDARRLARFRCVIAVAGPDGEIVFRSEGSVPGRILTAERGDRGFGYDPLFFHEGFGATFAEVPIERKSLVSHRATALARLVEALPELIRRHRLDHNA